MPVVAAPAYPLDKITPEFVDELERIDAEQGHDAALARFRTEVQDEPWFQQPSHAPIDGPDRIEWELLCLLTGEGFSQ